MKLTMAFFLVLLLPINTAQAGNEIILKQNNAPLEISNYSATYRSPDRGIGDGSIIHRLSVKNISDQTIEAYGLGFYAFDAFNRSLGRPFVGYDMSAISAAELFQPSWENRVVSAYLFRKHGTAAAYVAIVRFRDGTIWKANETDIAIQLESLELELSEQFE